MKLISNSRELYANIKTLDEYISKKADPEYGYALDLIKKGICFAALSYDGGFKFYPSRFIGYKNNSMDSHLSNNSKNGKETTPIISKIVNNGKSLVYDLFLEQKYIEYCASLGFAAPGRGSFGIVRKYWNLDILR